MIHIPHTSFSQIREKVEENYLSLQEMRISEIALTALKYLTIGGLATMTSGALGMPVCTFGLTLGFVAYFYILTNHQLPPEHKKPWMITAQSVSQIIIMSCLIGISLLPFGAETLLEGVATAACSTGYSLPIASYIFSMESPVFLEKDIQQLEIRTDVTTIQEEILTARTLIQMTTKEIGALAIRLPHIFTPLFLKNHLSPARLGKVFNTLTEIAPLNPQDFTQISSLCAQIDTWNTEFTLSDKTTEELQEKLYRSGSLLLKEIDNYEIKMRKHFLLFQMQNNIEKAEILKKQLESVDQLNKNLESLDDIIPISSGLRFTAPQWKEILSTLGFPDKRDFENTVKRGFREIGLYTYNHLQEAGILHWGQGEADLTPAAFLDNIDHFKSLSTKADLDKMTILLAQMQSWTTTNYRNMTESDENVIDQLFILWKKMQSHMEWYQTSIKTPNPDFQKLLESLQTVYNNRASDLFIAWSLIRAKDWNATHFPIGDVSLLEKELLYKKGKRILSQLKNALSINEAEAKSADTTLALIRTIQANLASLNIPPVSSYLHFSQETTEKLLDAFEQANPIDLNNYLDILFETLGIYTYSDLVENEILEVSEDDLSYENFMKNIVNQGMKCKTHLATQIPPPIPSQRSVADKVFHHTLKLFPTLLSLFLFPTPTILGIACGAMLRNTERYKRVVNNSLQMISKVFNEVIKGPFTFKNPPSREILSIENHARRSFPFLLCSSISFDLLPSPLGAFMVGIIEGPQIDEYVTSITDRAKSISYDLHSKMFPTPSPLQSV